jgi:type IV pilus assembly protein PilB
MPLDSHSDEIAILRETPIFKGGSVEALNQLVSFFEKVQFSKGDPVFVAQGVCQYVWVVAKGSVEIVSYDAATKESRQLVKLGQGQTFAEVAALTGTRHTAGAFALEACELLRIKVDIFKQALIGEPIFARNMVARLASLVHSSIQKSQSLEVLPEGYVAPTDEAMLRQIPFEFVTQNNVIPIELKGRRLTLGSLEPLNPDLYEQLRKRNPGIEIKPVILSPKQFNAIRLSLAKTYSTQAFTKSTTKTDSLPASVDCENLLQFSLLFSQLPSNIHKQLLPYLKEVRYQAGDIIQSFGVAEPPSVLVAHGQVEVFKHMTDIGLYHGLMKLNENDVCFDLSSLEDFSSSIGVLAVTDAIVFEIPKALIQELMKLPDFILPLCQHLAHTLRDLNQNTDGVDVVTTINNMGYGAALPNVSEDFQKLHSLLILGEAHQEVHIGTPKLLSTDAVVGLKLSIQGRRIKEKIISRQLLNEVRQRGLGAKEGSHTGPNVHELRPKIENFKAGSDDTVKLLNRVIIEAVRNRTSDIHLEPREHGVIVRYRIDGSLTCMWEDLPRTIGIELIRRAKLLSKMDTSESRMPQDGRFHVHEGDIEVELRASIVPTRHGEKIVMRLIGKRGEIISLRQLASDQRTTAFLNRIVKFKQGIFLVSGPTGSGKSTTLYSVLAELNALDVNIVTIEDPIEVNVAGINQIEVNQAIGLLPSILLRSVLRQDPDVIMIGEIRDAESMKLALEASMTGHLVLTTIHANSSLEVLPRLQELGASPEKIASDIIGVMAQRLIRALCNHCKKSSPVTDEELKVFKTIFGEVELLTKTMKPVGCPKCNFTGYYGQIPIFEFWERKKNIRNALLDGGSMEKFMEAVRESGYETLEQYGLRMVAFGITSFSELESVVYGLGWEESTDSAA